MVPSSAHDTQTTTVLKGVVRVEMLPTPSDHIPALMSRVKPIYLSRTYGVPLPSADDPSKPYDPNSFLDTLARMKGRLLKGGEPDVEGVAKILLSDWVRGRIPFFVSPPERPADLNVEKKGKEKGKADAVPVPGVTQKLSGIMQKNTFAAEDIKPLEEIDNGTDGVEGDSPSEADDDEDDEFDGMDDEAEDGDDNEDVLVWEDVFQSEETRRISKVVEDSKSVAGPSIYPDLEMQAH